MDSQPLKQYVWIGGDVAVLVLQSKRSAGFQLELSEELKAHVVARGCLHCLGCCLHLLSNQEFDAPFGHVGLSVSLLPGCIAGCWCGEGLVDLEA